MELTIGMAHHRDYDGVYFSVMALRSYFADVIPRCELIVVDNSVGTEESNHVATLLGGSEGGFGRVVYEPYMGAHGTTQTRQRIFDLATTPNVLVMDCHVLFQPGSLEGLLAYFAGCPERHDIVSGPLLYDGMASTATHFNNKWRGQMWGTWGSAFTCANCWEHGAKPLPQDSIFSPVEVGEGKDLRCEYRSLIGDGTGVITKCPVCAEPIPPLPWPGHEVTLVEQGFHRIGHHPNDPMFRIPGQGLGVFACRKADWLGFNPNMRGFGGEEMYIHGKFRKAGHGATCLPVLRWVHRFGRPGGPKYSLNIWDKVRNYVLGHQELGLDLEPVREHFVTAGLFPGEGWNTLLQNPVQETAKRQPHAKGCGSCAEQIKDLTVQGLYEFYRDGDKAGDFNHHFDTMRRYAERCDSVVEFGKRDYGIIPFMAAGCSTVTTYNQAQAGAAFWWTDTMLPKHKTGTAVYIYHEDHLGIPPIPKTDLLFVDSFHNRDQLHRELELHGGQVQKYIILHDTAQHWVNGDNGGKGLQEAIMRFLREHPEWTVVHHTNEQYGLMVLSKCSEDKPKRPGALRLAKNLAQHVLEYAADGMQNVTKEHLEARLNVCSLCPSRNGGNCTICGCVLLHKAKWKAMRCDANKWVPVDLEFVEPDHVDQGQ